MNAASPNTLRLVKGTPYGNNDADYIAVSYSWTPTPRLECDRNGGYAVIGARGGHPRKSVVRDEVLKRVLRYANHIGKCRIWIDKECSPQENSVKKQTAMDSMDLVYRLSRHPIGLLAIVFDDQSEVNYLQMLMMGSAVARRSEDEYPRLAHSAISRTSLGIFDVLVHMYEDRWWSRAWIFQEEYLSSTAMQILIRRKQGVLVRRKFGLLQGEICLNAVDFRKQATLFLLAFKRESRCGRAKKCSRMLRRFGRYEIQYHFQHDARRKAMSPRIFADIQRRGLENPFDRLPIVANSCNYAIRLVSRNMLYSGHSVEL
jgi:ribosomal protein L31E